MASGINSTFRQVGVATGIAAWGALFQHEVTKKFVADAGAAANRLGDHVADFVSFGGAQRTGDQRVIRIAEAAFDSGLNHILLIAAIVALSGAVLTGLLVRPADFVTSHAPGAVPAEA
jgi:hypothetical protein